MDWVRRLPNAGEKAMDVADAVTPAPHDRMYWVRLRGLRYTVHRGRPAETNARSSDLDQHSSFGSDHGVRADYGVGIR